MQYARVQTGMATHFVLGIWPIYFNFILSWQVISKMREVLAFMSLSSYTLDYFDLARERLHIPRGLQSIGETRFGTIYWSLDSVLQGMPAFIDIIRNSTLGIESEVCT